VQPDAQFRSVLRELEPADARTAVSIIAKLTGEACNINCFYCYEKRKPYPSDTYLAPETLEAFLDGLKGHPISLELHGGEPLLLGRARMRSLLEKLSTYPNVVRLAMQTNGTLLDEKWLDLFDELAPKLELGISLDGDDDANRFRVDGHADIKTTLRYVHMDENALRSAIQTINPEAPRLTVSTWRQPEAECSFQQPIEVPLHDPPSWPHVAEKTAVAGSLL
jgi:sulfatase maturation enzyme AslB (radical SAM superfamily)